ncbi:exonuclease domain-containing protein [Litoreibacter roseus]|uniref:DNA-directed DNA polymerase n=1 Tax=Litoreibacter roseus TaxID=2601869 RepID=A0A6N6JCK4_9RHOB|nr:exonuclease domain-containing protein [Litoreibacter roseus]GFE62932.1 hypothetical protein KIN_00060 [Litoreibacter roseus]
MNGLSLRLRAFLLFCAIAIGGIGITLVALLLAYRQLGLPDVSSAFVTAFVVASFGFALLSVGIWLWVDDHCAKPLERLAADIRTRAHSGHSSDLDPSSAPHLGDIGPAAAALCTHMRAAREETGRLVTKETAQLVHEKEQLIAILSDIPIAVMMVNAAHQIVLYDGQAAEMMEREAPVRLNASVYDYFKEGPLKTAVKELRAADASRIAAVLESRSGASYSGHLRKTDYKGGYTLMLEPMSPDAERPLTYDFALLERRTSVNLEDTPLRDLSYVVFDTETTGLLPHKDEVVQIGAVRVVNGKQVVGEKFDCLVNPGVPIPRTASRVHGITDSMVATSRDIIDIGRDFHKFSTGAVMVAHNAPFDMAFLHRYSKQMGVRFDHPILDTVLLSAIVFGASARHTLDDLCARFSITIPPHLRHTAMGDAVATADVFTSMLPILEARGISTFGDVLSEMRKHQRILKDQNE